jgi:hypothetical protein
MLPKQSTPRQVVADFRAAALSSGRYDLMVSEYRYPLTVYLKGQPQVVPSPKDAWAFFQTFHSAMRSKGYDRMTARVTAEDLPRGDRFRIWTDWTAEGQSQRGIIASTICYCSVIAGNVVTDMIEFTKITLPLLAA